jgi:hypothetical protein
MPVPMISPSLRSLAVRVSSSTSSFALFEAPLNGGEHFLSENADLRITASISNTPTNNLCVDGKVKVDGSLQATINGPKLPVKRPPQSIFAEGFEDITLVCKKQDRFTKGRGVVGI